MTARKISRQRKYQLKMRAEERCTICGQPQVVKGKCQRHYEMVKANARRYRRGKAIAKQEKKP